MNNSIIPKPQIAVKRKKLPSNSTFDHFRDMRKKLDHNSTFIKNRRSSMRIGKGSSLDRTVDRTPNYLWIVFFVKKFIAIMKSNVWLQKLKKFRKFHFEIIGDTSYFSFEPINQSALLNNPLIASMKKGIFDNSIKFLSMVMKNICSISNRLLHYIGVFEPDSKVLFILKFLVVIFTVGNLFFIPLSITFQYDREQVNEDINLLFLDIPFVMLVINSFAILNTAFYSKGSIIHNRKEILVNYFREYLLLDSLIIAPSVILYFFESVSLKVILLLRIVHLLKVLETETKNFLFRGKVKGFFKLSQLIISLFYISHVFGCFWIWFGKLEIQYGISNSWLIKLQVLDKPDFEIYIDAIYFAVVTMVTVGYGDFSPHSVYEKLVGIIFMFFSCGVFAYSLNFISEIVNEMKEKEEKFQAFIGNIKYYLNQRGISPHLQMKIRKYLEYMHLESLEHASETKSMLMNKLSKKLGYEFLIDCYGPILKKNKVFEVFSSEFISKICLKIEEMTFAPGEEVYKAHEEKDLNLFIVLKGEIELFHSTGGDQISVREIPIRKITKGNIFGEYSFFTKCPREISARSVGVTSVGVINLEIFQRLISEMDEDYQKYCELRDDIFLNKDLGKINYSCKFCKKSNHLIQNCQDIKVLPSFARVKENLEGIRFQRRDFSKKRKKMLRYNCLHRYYETIYSAEIYLHVNEDHPEQIFNFDQQSEERNVKLKESKYRNESESHSFEEIKDVGNILLPLSSGLRHKSENTILTTPHNLRKKLSKIKSIELQRQDTSSRESNEKDNLALTPAIRSERMKKTRETIIQKVTSPHSKFMKTTIQNDVVIAISAVESFNALFETVKNFKYYKTNYNIIILSEILNSKATENMEVIKEKRRSMEKNILSKIDLSFQMRERISTLKSDKLKNLNTRLSNINSSRLSDNIESSRVLLSVRNISSEKQNGKHSKSDLSISPIEDDDEEERKEIDIDIE